MALEFLFNKTNLDLEDPAVLGGPVNGNLIHGNTPQNQYTTGPNAVTKNKSPIETNFKFATDNITSLRPPANGNPDPTQFPATTLGSTNISGHFPTAGKPSEIFTQKYTPESTYLDQINSQ